MISLSEEARESARAPQTPFIVHEEDVRRALPSLDIRGALEDMFAALGSGEAVQPPQTLTLFPRDAGDFITYLGVLAKHEVFGAKLSPYVAQPGAPIVTAWTALMSMRTGAPLMWCDSALLTTERTAGTTALAVDRLARASSERLAIIGSGSVALAHLRHVAPLREWSEIRIHSPRLTSEARARYRRSMHACASRPRWPTACATRMS
ncbi:ornithine cyclodeaminase/mu-crystallin [Caballeronia temeraria]|uniref:Ornithine cyclodeaminase/mu-crystallin n=1 Tax=Caballeronia temeraria TaxID=1777137 RepID=A0A158D7X2_9BURK|nr:ornithine cyclodeaminase/mu-crystallin [Caballeronia temeraria]